MKSFRKLLAGLLATSLLLVSGAQSLAAPATSYTVHDVPDMTLAVRISATQTAGIKINWPRFNGIQYAYPTTSGGILQFTRSDGYTEQIYYSRAINTSATKTFTLSGSVVRSVPWNSATSFVTSAAGVIFTPGSKVRLVNDARLFNLSTYVDRNNVMTGSGAFESTQTNQPFLFPNRVTTAQRDAFSYGKAATQSPIIFNTTISAMQYWNGSSWQSFGSGTTVNATTSVRGAVELATVLDIVNRVFTGTSGAQTVLGVDITARSSTGSTQANKVPVLGANGYLSGSLLGSGTPSSTTFLRGDNSWQLPTSQIVYGTAADGNKTLSGSITLSRDMNYNTLALNGFTVRMNGFRVYARTISGSGSMQANNGVSGTAGGNAVGGTQGSAGVGGKGGTGATLPSRLNGPSGGAGGGGSATIGGTGASGTGSLNPHGNIVAVVGVGGGGGGADGSAGGGAGPAGTAGTLTNSSGSGNIMNYLTFSSINAGSLVYRPYTGVPSCGGAGGGGSGRSNGGTAGTGGGGGGGGGEGGAWFIASATISGTWTVVSTGGNGGNGGNASNASGDAGGGGGGGGGCGGPGGSGVFIYNTNSTWTGSFTLTGGTPGSAGALGTGGGSGSAGGAGTAGNAGPTGKAVVVNF